LHEEKQGNGTLISVRKKQPQIYRLKTHKQEIN
jgi:hypothetical protein